MDYHGAIDHILKRLKVELTADLSYHNLEHTLAVTRNCRKIAKAEGISEHDLKLLLTAAAYHDAGFLEAYADNEPVGCRIAEEALARYNYQPRDIERVKALILATRPSRRPENELQEIICDADLFYLGGDQYYDIAESLHRELRAQDHEISDEEWLKMQIDLLEKHRYYTSFARRTRDANKKKILKELCLKQQKGD